MKKQKELTWAEIKAMYAETDRRFKETARQMKETDRIINEKFDRLDKLFAQTREQIGGISRSNGEFCEEYFINCFKEDPTFMGEKYDQILEYVRPYPKAVIDDEYDLILHNGNSVVLIEMKYKARLNDVGKMFSKLESYRANYPMNKNYKIYLCLASFRFSKNIREKADEEGVVLIQQKGDKNEVISKNIRTW